ncbi:histone-lysine N-methyltransferase SETD5 isoform X2 [Scleropages formosus]|uniref:histone-lysine N-methyltransferase SETD5 isoform X2 n=1 Tax=Scleropages formosus TaxID=113540 RepID=UPI0008782E47|nr:histone-lysine N-methyltransferase SETD5 isoform X2 [Scleropages formosus]
MSIVIALGVTTPETSYSDMAAGSDPESVEASPAVNEKTYSNHSCGSAQNHGYRGLPYAMQQSCVVCCQDHNYGAPPPPTPPASPLSHTIIPRVELSDVMCSDLVDDNTADSDSSSDEDEDVGVPSWCPCSLTQDGFLIKCDSCRGLERRKGVDAQRRKPENVSVGDSSATESGDEEVSPSTVSYTATQHTPTSITLTVNRVKRSKPKKRKKSTEKAQGTPKPKKIKAFREGSRKSMRMKNSTTEASTLDENTEEGWESKIRQWTDQYEEALANQYSADVQTLLQLHREGKTSTAATMDNINRTELACNNTVVGSQMQLQLGRVTRVQKHRKILRAARDLETDTLIIEYRGKVMLKQQFEVNGHFFKKPYPFVLFYSKFNEVEMCVDARTFGNDARFIRRSCTPNAEVRHMIADGMIHLCIYAVTRITKDSEVTIGFDYEFNSCNYKVDCACHKGNQNCPVQKHNLNPPEQLLRPPSLPVQVGAETRRRKARRKELEAGVLCSISDESSQPPEETRGGSMGASDAEEGLCDGLKMDDGEEAELDENGALIQSRRTREERKAEAIMQVFENLEKRRKRGSQIQDRSQGSGTGVEESKQEDAELGDSTAPLAGTVPMPTGVGVSTRRASYFTEAPPEVEKVQVAPPAPKPPPARSSKPRPKSRISRYRSSSSQRARRQRQALAQQAADQVPSMTEEGAVGTPGSELGVGEGVLAGGQPADIDGLAGAAIGAPGNKAGLRYPKTKKYLVTEWLNDKVLEKPECPVERPLRITTDPTVLATTLNMLPGLSHSPLICTTPKHYVRFGSPFTPERRRRPVIVDGSYGSFKKRWIKQAQDESLNSSCVEGGLQSSSSHQSNSSSSASSPFKAEISAPFKKRKCKYSWEPLVVPQEELLRPLSPITPPLPCNPPQPLLILSSTDERHNGYSLNYSPLPSLPTSRCNTPLQFENISSPEASPVHRPESLSPEPCLRPDLDGPRAALPDLSLPSSLESPAATEDAPTVVQESFGVAPLLAEAQLREQSFRTEFNLIYTCSPLNSNMGEGLSGRRLSQSEGGFSPAESFRSSAGGQGLLLEAGSRPLSPYMEPHYMESGTSPHPSNPPQKKKRANLHTISLLTGKPDYQALSVRSEYKTVQNMVSLLEYRKRKQGAKEPEGGGNTSNPEPPSGLRSPHSCFSSPAHPSIPQVEEVSPPDRSMVSHSRPQDSTSHWMVPTSVERLREGQGVLERVLRGSLKMERVLKRVEAGADKESELNDAESFEAQVVSRAQVSPVKSPQRYSHSPSMYPHQSHLSETHQKTEPAAFLQQSASSPFRGSYSPSTPSPGQGYYSRLSSRPLPQDLSQQQSPNPAPSYPNHPSSVDLTLCGTPGKTGGAQQHHHHQLCSSGGTTTGVDGSQFYSGSHLKPSMSNSGLTTSATSVPRSLSLPQISTKTDTIATTGNPLSHASRLSQQPKAQTLSPESSGQTMLQTGARLLPTSGSQHYAQRGTPISQFQHPQIQGSGVRTQTGSY